MWKAAAVAALIAALAFRYIVSQSSGSITFRGGQDYPAPPQPAALLTPDEIAAFRRDGFLLKKRAVGGAELEELVRAGERLYRSKTPTDWLFRKVFAKLSTQIWRQDPAFAQTAFESSLPGLAARLMGGTDRQRPLRILKDGFFGFDGSSNAGCSFHVDDKFFWPAADDTTGVNAWLTLSEVTAAGGGGIRVVNQSLAKPFFEECLAVIRGGGGGPESYNSTCHMDTLSPPCFDRMMAASVVYDMEPGDALLWDRWTFHRSEPLHGTTAAAPAAAPAAAATTTLEPKLRYTIRYVPETATAEGAVHASIEQGAPLTGPYYPQVWPAAIREEVDAIRAGLEPDLALSPKFLLGVLLRRLRSLLVSKKD